MQPLMGRLRVAYALGGFNGKRHILDVGCASGYFGEAIKHVNTVCSVIGVDIVQSTLAKAKKNCDGVVCCDAVHLPFRDKTFDYASCLETLEHVKEDKQAVDEISRVLMKDGVLVVSVPRSKALANMLDPAFWLTHKHKRRYSKDQLLGLFKGSDFSISSISARGGFMSQINFIISTVFERLGLPNFLQASLTQASDKSFKNKNGCKWFVKACKTHLYEAREVGKPAHV